MLDDELVKKLHKIMNGDIGENFRITQDEMLIMKGMVCMLDIDDLRKAIMKKTYCSTYAMHPCSTKMYRTIKENYWQSSMKSDITEFVSNCLVCQQMKVEHQKPVETFQPLLIPKWKWEHVTIDFIVSFPCTQIGYDAI